MPTVSYRKKQRLYLNQQLEPVRKAARRDPALRRELALYLVQHGADVLKVGLQVKKFTYGRDLANPFQVLAAYRFGEERGLVKRPRSRRTSPSKDT